MIISNDSEDEMFLPQEDFATVVRSTPLISIDLLVENEQGDILLGKRINRPARGFWFVPGGRVQKNETLQDAFARLTEVELGIRLPLSSGNFYGIWQHFYNDNFTDEDFTTHYVVLAYYLTLSAKNLKLPNEQHDDYQWMKPASLLSDKNVHKNSRAYFDNKANLVIGLEKKDVKHV